MYPHSPPGITNDSIAPSRACPENRREKTNPSHGTRRDGSWGAPWAGDRRVLVSSRQRFVCRRPLILVTPLVFSSLSCDSAELAREADSFTVEGTSVSTPMRAFSRPATVHLKEGTAGEPLTLHLEAVLTGVGPDGRTAFAQIADVAVSPDGDRVSVFDAGRCVVAIYTRSEGGFLKSGEIEGCGGEGRFLQPVSIVDAGAGPMLWDATRSELLQFSIDGALVDATPVSPPIGGDAQYYPAQLLPAGADQFGAPVLQWEVVLPPGPSPFTQVLFSLPNGASPFWLGTLSAEATGAERSSDQTAFSHGVEACWSSDRSVMAIEGRGTQHVAVFNVFDFLTQANWTMVTPNGEGTALNSTQLACFPDAIMIRKRVYDQARSGFFSGHDHFFAYDGSWLGSRRIGDTLGDRELGKVLDVRGYYFVTASNVRFESPTVFVWHVSDEVGSGGQLR